MWSSRSALTCTGPDPMRQANGAEREAGACGGLGCTSPLGSRGGSSSGAGRLERLSAGLGRFGVLGKFCGGRGLPLEVAVGEGAACGQGEGGDGQGGGVTVVEGAGGGVQ